MPKKRKSSSKRSPQNRPGPHKYPGPSAATRTPVPARREAVTGMAQLRGLAQAQLTAPTRSVERQPAQPSSVPAAAAGEVPARGAAAAYGVGATYWLEGDDEAPSAVHFMGTGVDGDSRGEQFERQVAVPALSSGVGRTSVTAAVRDLPAGTWHIRTQAVDKLGQPVGVPQYEDRASVLSPFVRGPGVRPLAWSVLVLLGVVMAVVVQVLLVRAEGLDARPAALSAVAAAAVGYLVAKAGYMVLHRVPPSGFAGAGTLIQVFLVGAFAALVGFATLADLPVLRLLDLTTPGVFAAMAVARPGCWLGGCCAGRPTSSRWGLWSSDRRIGVRRVPVQLMESGLAATIAITSLLLVLTVDQRPYGVVLALAVSVYTFGRQLLFPLRGERRRTSRGRILTMAAAAAVTIGSLAVLLTGAR